MENNNDDANNNLYYYDYVKKSKYPFFHKTHIKKFLKTE